ncbi:hypothetical protein H7J93_17170 [Mycobacterium barrassiae]|nr:MULTISPECIES: hypothetical protein [Mycobacteriaceae]MCV7301351.1 hypothetical protein [Mycobacterium barrassiae]OBA97211.1 hypothetical protein A5668_03410 [Mycolicibacterium fortuitum]UBV13985.1 hypothetical protein H8Z57_24825 [Mycolicibacterium fortuitum]
MPGTDANTANDDPNYRNPKCYVNTYGGCSRKISGEHFITHSIIKLYSFGDDDVTVKHDNGRGIREFVSPKKFVTNILCTNHNTALHNADDAALEVAKFLFNISTTYKCGTGQWGDPAEITVSGDDFQVWVLKLLLNHVMGKAFPHQRDESVNPFPPECVDLLLGRVMWPNDQGLCVAGDPSNKDLMLNDFGSFEDIISHHVSFQPFIFGDHIVGRGGEVAGGIVNLNGVGFGMTVVNTGRSDAATFNAQPGNPLRGSVLRPRSIAWKLGGVEKRINFTWSDIWNHEPVTYTINVRG